MSGDVNFVKLYKIRPEHIHDDGSVDPDVPLYPYFAGQYGWANKPESELKESLDKPTMYDNNTNAHPDRVYQLHDDRNNKIYDIGPNVKRGFSANARNTRGSGRARSTVIYNEHDDNKHKTTYHIPKDNRVYDDEYFDEDEMPDDTFYGLMNTSIGLQPDVDSDGLITLPTIVSAKPEDIVTYEDILSEGYSPARDNQYEVTLKNIHARRLPDDKIYDKLNISQKAQEISFKLNSLSSQLKPILMDLKPMLMDLNRSDKQDTLRELASNVIRPFERELLEALNSIESLEHLMGKYILSDCTSYYNLDRIRIKMSDLWLLCSRPRLYVNRIKAAITGIFDAYNDTDIAYLIRELDKISQEYQGKTTVRLKNFNAHDWFPSYKIYSDEDIKDIKDTKYVKLSNKQKFNVLRDFMNWHSNRDLHNDILSGIKELGQ